MVGQLHDVDLRLLRVFKAVVEAGGLSAAEVTLNMSVSNISTRISELEKRLEVRLCNRGRQRFALTDQGQQVYGVTLELMASLEHFRNQLQQTQNQICGELRLMITDNTLEDPKFPIVKVIEQFRLCAPAVYIRLELGCQTEVEQSVVNGDVHLGITSLTEPLDKLECQFLYTEDTFLYCGVRHPLFQRKLNEVTAADIEQCGFIDTEAGGHSAVPITGSKQTASAASLEARALLILTGGYVGFLPSHYAQRWVRGGEMRVLLPGEMQYQKKMYLLAKKGKGTNPAVDAFIDELKAAYIEDEVA